MSFDIPSQTLLTVGLSSAWLVYRWCIFWDGAVCGMVLCHEQASCRWRDVSQVQQVFGIL